MATPPETSRTTRSRRPAKPKKRGYGRGSVSLQDGSYVATYKSLETGRPVRRSFSTDPEAQVFLDEWYAEKQRRSLWKQRGGERAGGMVPAPPPAPVPAEATFAELIDGWRAFKSGTIRATTWRNYEPALRALTYYLGDRKVDQLTETHFVKYRQAREKGLDWVKRTRVAPLKAVTINQHLDRAHAIFEWATAASPPLATHNPVARLVKRGNKLKVERFEPVVVDAETIEALIAAAAPEFRLEFTLMGHLAMRWGEALGVGVGHIKDGKVLVRQQVIEDRTTKPCTMTISTYGGKTKYARRDLWASEAILEASQAAYERPNEKNPHRLLRPTRTGQPFRSNNWIRQAWLPALKRAGLQGSGLTPHGLRHSRLSIMAASGRITLGDLSAFAGHASVAFTLTRYGDHFSSAGIRPELYLGTQAAS
jgi:integrase